MGLSASQARLLMLTARKSDLEYQAQQICQSKLALAQQEEAIATEYSDAIGNTKYSIATWITTSGQNEKTFIDFTYQNLINSNYYLMDSNGKIVQTLEDYESGLAASSDKSAYASKYMSDEIIKNDEGGANSYIKAMIEKGEYILVRSSDNKQTTVSQAIDLSETYDTDDDAAAEAKYKAETSKIQSKEKQLDLKLKQIETEQSAVSTEIESVQKIVKDNVESTFKTFG